MFKKLRINIIVVVISVFAILFTSIMISIYVASYQKSISDTKFVLNRISRMSGFKKLNPPHNESKNMRNYFDSSKYYLVCIKDGDTILRIANDEDSGYTDKELGELALQLSHNKLKHGSIKNLSYLVAVRKGLIYVAFSNDSIQINYLDSLFYNILLFGCIGLALLFIISIWLSKWLVMPVEAVFKKQNQFISDASHELKTPIAIISSNADVLQREIGESKWLDYINAETVRMNKLVTDLLDLVVIDSNEDKTLHKKFNLSETVMSIVLPFESIAFEKQISLSEKINENIYMIGDSSRIGQLTSILLDNAFNHTEKGGQISVQLKQQHNKRVLTVSNTGKEIPIEEQELIFERFYRVDEARTREKGNYGLGLSIAKSITKSHNGKIFVSCKDNWTTFKVVM